MGLACLVVVVAAISWRDANSSGSARPSESRTNSGALSSTDTIHLPSTGSRVFFVAPEGPGGTGTEADPFVDLERALAQLQPGDTLYVRGGTYKGRVEPVLEPATADHPITVAAFPGERPVLEGLLWLENASHWRIRGMNVTWSDDFDSEDHMVKLTGGASWEFTDAEVWGARSYAAILVAGDATDFTLARLFVHDTIESNDKNQDHLIYVNNGSGGGVIEHSVLARSENGRAVKLGGTDDSAPAVRNVVIRYNTMIDNKGPSSVQLSYGASDNAIERNVFVDPGGSEFAVTVFRFDGRDNVVANNLGWDLDAVVQPDVQGLVDGAGNVVADPDFTDPEADDFTPRADGATAYGHTAGP